MSLIYRHRRLLFIPLVLLAACSESTNPTRPSPVVSQANAAGRIVDWTSVVGLRPDALAVVGQDAPGAPANLTFSVEGSTVALMWAPPAGGPTATSYLVEAGTASGATNITRFNTGSTATTLTATGVPNGTYFVRVRGVNADGPGGPSNEVTILIGGPGPGTPPGPPPCPVRAPSGLIGSANGNTITLLWTGVGSGALSYVIEVGTAPGASNIVRFDTGTLASSFTGAAPNGTFYIRVRSRAECGIGDSSSNEVVVTVSGGSGAPTATGRWVGVSPDGMVADVGTQGCPLELDLDMNITVAGSTVRGSATTRVRRVTAPSFCSDNSGSTATYTVNGTAGSDGSISMQLGTGNPVYSMTGSVTSTRMNGRWTDIYGAGGSFTVNRQ